MITGAIAGWFGAFVGWLGGLVSLPTPPAFFGTLQGYAVTAGGYVANTGVWMPWTVIATVLGAWVTALAAALIVKIVRIVASFLTAGGGSAA